MCTLMPSFTSYQLFMLDNTKSGGGSDDIKRCSEMWNSMSKDEIASYTDRANQENQLDAGFFKFVRLDGHTTREWFSLPKGERTRLDKEARANQDAMARLKEAKDENHKHSDEINTASKYIKVLIDHLSRETKVALTKELMLPFSYDSCTDTLDDVEMASEMSSMLVEAFHMTQEPVDDEAGDA